MPVVNARLAETAHKLPLPGRPGSFFPAAGMSIDLSDPFWHALVADGSLEIVEDSLPPAEDETPPADAADPADR